jgi:hypothetical protein
MVSLTTRFKYEVLIFGISFVTPYYQAVHTGEATRVGCLQAFVVALIRGVTPAAQYCGKGGVLSVDASCEGLGQTRDMDTISSDTSYGTSSTDVIHGLKIVC